MAKVTRMGLFVTRFTAFNLDRYKDDAEKKALFTGLTESELSFGTITKGANGLRSTTVTSASRNFVGNNQSWTAAKVNNPKAFTMTDPTVYPSLDDVKALTAPGVYAYSETVDTVTSTKVCILVAHGTADAEQPDAAKAAYIAALKYDVVDEDVTTDTDSVNIDSPCLIGDVVFAEAAMAELIIPDTDYGQLELAEDEPA